MMKLSFPSPRVIRAVLLAAALATFLLMVAGIVLRVSESAPACPDWPTCYGQWGLPQQQGAGLEVIHRGLAALSGLLVLLSAGMVLRGRVGKGLRLVVFGALALTSTQMVLGGLYARTTSGAPVWLSPLHMGLALLTLGLMSFAVTLAFWQPGVAGQFILCYRTRFARLSLAVLVGVLILMVSGALLVSANTGGACAGWPLCAGGLPNNPAAWLELGHRGITALVSLLITLQFIRAWRTQRSQPAQLVAVSGVFVLFIGQVLLGALKVMRGFPADLVGLHAASAAALWAVQAVAVAAIGLAGRSEGEEAAEAGLPLPFRARLKDFVVLSKPVIVALLLVTTYAGMVVAGGKLPSLALTFWTMLGGALAAGGSSALNQYIDREIDGEMQRTARRPLPAGRLQPAEGLAYGLAACLLSFFLLAGFVNLLAALLSLAGMIYYVLLYSIWLKRLTVQNIVIGGGAGAIPPLVGWAAATGGLNVPALMLFAIVFLWTPPHFWALALVRRNDYARASIPMLPVVRGEQYTRVQIFIYTLELVALTLLMPLFRITGSVYLISAVLLGGYLIYAAWRVLRKDGNKPAWQMYRYSSMYLMLLFLALVIDALV